MKTAKQKLPTYILEGKGNFWIIWDTVNHEVTGTFETRESAESTLKQLNK